MVLQMVIKCFLVDDIAAPDINQYGIFFHPCQFFSPDEISGVPIEGSGDHNHIRRFQHRFQIHGIADEIDGCICFPRSVNTVYLHAHGLHGSGNCLPVSAKSNDTANTAPELLIKSGSVKSTFAKHFAIWQKIFSQSKNQC